MDPDNAHSMARSSIALFLAVAGLAAGTVACGGTPEPMEGGEVEIEETEMMAPDAMEEGAGMDEGGEGGEGGEG
jgi:hypothetical protein